MLTLLVRGLWVSLGLVVGTGLIWVSLWQIASFEPHCAPSPQWVCGESVEEQRASLIRFALLPIALGVGVFLFSLWKLVTTIRDRHEYMD